MNERELDALIRDADPYTSVRDIDLSADGQSLLEEIMLNVTPLDVQRRRVRWLKWLRQQCNLLRRRPSRRRSNSRPS